MIYIEGYGHNPNDALFERLAKEHAGRKLFLVEPLAVNTNAYELPEYGVDKETGETVQTGTVTKVDFAEPESAIYTRAGLRQMRRALSFANVPEQEYNLAKLAVLAGDASAREQAVVAQQEADFAAADEWYESMKAASRGRVGELTVAEIDELASELGHEWSSGSLTKAARVSELAAVDLI